MRDTVNEMLNTASQKRDRIKMTYGRTKTIRIFQCVILKQWHYRCVFAVK